MKGERFRVKSCSPKLGGGFLVVLDRGQHAHSDTPVLEGKAVRVVDGKVVEVGS